METLHWYWYTSTNPPEEYGEGATDAVEYGVVGVQAP